MTAARVLSVVCAGVLLACTVVAAAQEETTQIVSPAAAYAQPPSPGQTHTRTGA